MNDSEKLALLQDQIAALMRICVSTQEQAQFLLNCNFLVHEKIQNIKKLRELIPGLGLHAAKLIVESFQVSNPSNKTP